MQRSVSAKMLSWKVFNQRKNRKKTTKKTSNKNKNNKNNL